MSFAARPRPSARVLVPSALFAAALSVPSPATAMTTARLTSAPAPAVTVARCETGARWRCHARHTLALRGRHLDGVTSVAFVGGRGGRDDRYARARKVTGRRVVLTVPSGARSGVLRVRDEHGAVRTRKRVELRRARRSETLRRTSGVATEGDATFPIAGRHDMGRSFANSFGGGRGHQGHDLFADCGTKLVAATDAKVQAKAYHSAAGHYVVLQEPSGRSQAYMHMRSASSLVVGERVEAGDKLGYVGQTGRASGCHLHFELWTAPGWYTGGQPVDPLPQLEDWKD